MLVVAAGAADGVVVVSDVGLIDLDDTGFPNLALMKIAAWHKAQGDSVRLLRRAVKVDRLYASAVFTWNRRKADVLRSQGAIVGGTGVDLQNELPAEIEAIRPDYSLYGIDYGMGFLMRGCIWRCAFCVVPEKEGSARAVANIDDLLNLDSDRANPFVVLLDNEFFFKVAWAIERLEEFTDRRIDFCPSQGLDVRVVTPALADALATAPYWNLRHTSRQITFAFDDIRIERQYRRGVELLLDAGIPGRHLQSFVLVGFNSTINDDLRRIEIIREYNIDPYVMVYRDPRTGERSPDRQIRHLARWANRHLFRTVEFRDYWPEAKRRSQAVLL